MNETAILQHVLATIKPDQYEQQRMHKVADNIISLIEQTATRHGLSDVEAILVGSAARGTWISDEHDLDIFISFPEDYTDDDLKTMGLMIAREVAKRADNFIERYAEHPYIHAFFRDFEVDLVPCFRVNSVAQMRSAVDRTPFHNRFVLSRIHGLEDDVVLLKQFMKACRVYGSDLKTGGFSGYLAELLVIQYGSFKAVLKASDNWKPGMTIDISGHGSCKHTQVLIMVDPTDPARNVAAALTMDKFALFIDAAREYLGSPTIEQFFPAPAPALSDHEFIKILSKRGMLMVAVVFNKPDVVDDVLYPQLFVLHKSIRDLVERNEFCVYSGGVWAGETEAVVVLEFQVGILPPVKKHRGPPVWAKQHVTIFKKKYHQNKDYSHVYIENGRYVVDIHRKYTNAADLIRHEIHTCKLGKNIGESIRSGFTILHDDQLLRIKHTGFREFLRGFCGYSLQQTL
jgi:tRNA nucleotidyltransferase (CCA-adding enzyme)